MIGAESHLASGKYNEVITRLAQKASDHRIPTFGSLEITWRCNLNCVHCYLPHHKGTGDLTLEEICRIIDEIVEAGCISLLLTGGEVFVRKDFEEIYTHAKRKGLIVTLFSNAVNIPEKYFTLFKTLKPNLIDVSLYGVSDETYKATTGRPVFHQVMHNIQRLQDVGVRVTIKSTLLRTNIADHERFIELHRKLGPDMRMNAQMFHAYDGSDRPTDHRLTPREIIELEAKNEVLANEWRKAFSEKRARRPGDLLYTCGAGSNTFTITPRGELKLCGAVQKYTMDLRTISFREAWAKLRDPIEGIKKHEDHGCRDCNLSSWCMMCPAQGLLDMGDEQKKVPYLCEMTHLRAAQFSDIRDERPNALRVLPVEPSGGSGGCGGACNCSH